MSCHGVLQTRPGAAARLATGAGRVRAYLFALLPDVLPTLYGGFLWLLHEAYEDARAETTSANQASVSPRRYLPVFVVGTAIFVLGKVAIFVGMGR